MKNIMFLLLMLTSQLFAQQPGETEFQKAQKAYSEKNYQAWFDESLKSAEKGFMNGIMNLGYAYDPYYAQYYPVPAEKDIAKSFRYFKKGADLGGNEAAFITGDFYRLGEGTTKDDKKAIEYFKKAYESEYTEAGPMIYKMMGNATEYISYLESCVNRKLYHAAEDLGFIYIKGEIIDVDISSAMKWLEIGNQNNHAGCIYIIAYLHRNGFKKAVDGKVTLNNQDADIPKAVEYYTKAAQLGNIVSMNNLGEMNLQGLEIKQDLLKSFEWFEKSCSAGDGYGCYMCSMMIVNNYIDRPQEDAALFSQKSLKLGYMPNK
jgi:uncharacterized protein